MVIGVYVMVVRREIKVLKKGIVLLIINVVIL